MNTVVFNESRSNYYKAKKRELARRRQERQVVIEDALYIHHYGMSAFLELFPEAKYFGVNWHREVIAELQIIRKRSWGSYLVAYIWRVPLQRTRKLTESLDGLLTTY